MNKKIKTFFEDFFHCKVFRNSLPRGTDIFFDIERHFGITNFRMVFDVGANIGQSAMEYSKIFSEAKIFSFEPVTKTYDSLCENVSKIEQITPFHIAFGNENGKIEINLNNDSKINSIRHNYTGQKETIALERVDDFLARMSIETVDFMKIDTEGFEMEALQGAEESLKQQAIGMLYIEAEPRKTDNQFIPFCQLSEFMGRFGYELFGIYEQQPQWFGEKHIHYFNPVFICPKLIHETTSPSNYPFCI